MPFPLGSLGVWEDAPRLADPSAIIERLKSMFESSSVDPWRWNLLKMAVLQRQHVCVVALVLDEFYRYKRHGCSAQATDYDQEALIWACERFPSAIQTKFLLANVEEPTLKDPEVSLRVLLAATQSGNDSWACHVLHQSKDVVEVVRVARIGSPSEHTGKCSVATVAEKAARNGMHGLLRKLLALNRPAVVFGAGEWVDRWENAMLIVLARRRSARLRDAKTTISSDYGVKVETLADAEETACPPILTLPGPLFGEILSFVYASDS
jgi:hypothetical protein